MLAVGGLKGCSIKKGEKVKVEELLETLRGVNPEAEVFVAGYGDMPEEVNKVFMADELNSDKELVFCDFGDTFGDLAVLITYEDKD